MLNQIGSNSTNVREYGQYIFLFWLYNIESIPVPYFYQHSITCFPEHPQFVEVEYNDRMQGPESPHKLQIQY